MSKNSQNTFDHKFLNINNEIDEQIGKIRNSQMIYPIARIQKKGEDRNKRNISGQKKSNSSQGEINEKKNHESKK